MDTLSHVVKIGAAAGSSVVAMGTVAPSSNDELLKTVIATVVSVVVHLIFNLFSKRKKDA
ncbi:hypothetical protein [Arachidicoccus terrestris]|uniref:hypothetical protein n=1 Tax=Arachidicoccus terrestris TaxID=2875539 RepID=UPI001CC43E73|nr:hypothetical protein [Arachidicoccus terrestris]UAY54801.1 hypothetical protein K9M52_15335 [Arachidicoccus terrestris]